MQWRGGRRSSNVSDQRGSGGFRGGFGGLGGLGGGGLGGGRGPRVGGIGIIGIIAFFIIASVMGFDPMAILAGMTGGGMPSSGTTIDGGSNGDVGGDILGGKSGSAAPATTGTGDATEGELKDFVSVVLASTEDSWNKIFKESGGTYRAPTLVLFSGAAQSACGYAESAMGPFYCPPDQKVYIDLDFYRDLRERFAAPGDFAQAYVIAHEVGHHVQNLLGIEKKVRGATASMGKTEANAVSVRVELQADCFAGIWAHQVKAQGSNLQLEPGDIEEGLGAASAIGDDRLQKESTGRVMPDSFTHGSSDQRVRWFKRGLDSGDMESCDTFQATEL